MHDRRHIFPRKIQRKIIQGTSIPRRFRTGQLSYCKSRRGNESGSVLLPDDRGQVTDDPEKFASALEETRCRLVNAEATCTNQYTLQGPVLPSIVDPRVAAAYRANLPKRSRVVMIITAQCLCKHYDCCVLHHALLWTGHCSR